jgi:hypothetical protein
MFDACCYPSDHAYPQKIILIETCAAMQVINGYAHQRMNRIREADSYASMWMNAGSMVWR